jgi:hypothetical protein
MSISVDKFMTKLPQESLSHLLSSAVTSALLSRRPHLRDEQVVDKIVSITRPLKYFRSLPPSTVRALAAQVEYIKIAPHCRLYNAGDAPNSFYVILHGEASITREANGSDVVHATLSQGDAFGEVLQNATFLTNNKVELLKGLSHRLDNVRTLSQCELLVLPESTYSNLLRPIQSFEWADPAAFLRTVTLFDRSPPLPSYFEIVACAMTCHYTLHILASNFDPSGLNPTPWSVSPST